MQNDVLSIETLPCVSLLPAAALVPQAVGAKLDQMRLMLASAPARHCGAAASALIEGLEVHRCAGFSVELPVR
jgi:hypothetical protein